MTIGRIPVQTSLVTRLGFGTQSRYEAPGELSTKSRSRTVINIGVVRLPSQQRPNAGRGAAKYIVKKKLQAALRARLFP